MFCLSGALTSEGTHLRHPCFQKNVALRNLEYRLPEQYILHNFKIRIKFENKT